MAQKAIVLHTFGVQAVSKPSSRSPVTLLPGSAGAIEPAARETRGLRMLRLHAILNPYSLYGVHYSGYIGNNGKENGNYYVIIAYIYIYMGL